MILTWWRQQVPHLNIINAFPYNDEDENNKINMLVSILNPEKKRHYGTRQYQPDKDL